MKKVLFTATVDSHILAFHIPFLKYFKDQGYQVHVATNGSSKLPYCDVRHTVNFERSPWRLNNLIAVKQLKKIIDTEQFDLIHTHTPMGSIATRIAALEARRHYGTRLIYTVHGFHFFNGAPIENWLIYYPIEMIMAKFTDVITTINREDYELANRKFNAEVHYISGVGIDPAKFDIAMTNTEKKKLRESLGLSQTDFVLLYPAELNKNKNQTMMIDAMEQIIVEHPDVHLLLPGKDSLNGFHESLVKERKLERNIHFLGYRKDIPQLLKITNISVSTSRREGLPVNIMEAMYLGLPTVVTDCRGNRDLIKDKVNGYVVNLEDIETLASRITYLKHNKQIMSKMGKENRKSIEPYLLDKVLKKMHNIYLRSGV